MNYWIFICKGAESSEGWMEGTAILQTRLKDGFWGLGEKTPNRRLLQKGDQVVFYQGLPEMNFVATATLGSNSFVLDSQQKSKYSHGQSLFTVDYGVLLENIHEFATPHSAKSLVDSLRFIENKASWGCYLQGGVKQIPEEDFGTIVQNAAVYPPASVRTEDEIVIQTQFALESHLEEFIDRNWDNIDFGAKLKKYDGEEDQTGRQFPAGLWSIDFLCIDKASGDFVVIELKRGKTSDATVGQTLRYMAWVTDHLAKPGQKVRGIIIAQDVDDALKYAIKLLPGVGVLTYRVDFTLHGFKE